MIEKEMVTVKITKKAHEFLKEFTKNIKEQDNRATASPYYYVVRSTKTLPAPEGYGDRTILVDEEDEYNTFPTNDRDVLFKELLKDGHFVEDAREMADRCKLHGVHEVYERHNIFFTEKGYEDHMRLNKHNYSREGFGEAHSFVEHAFRNPEIETLLTIAKSIGGQDGG